MSGGGEASMYRKLMLLICLGLVGPHVVDRLEARAGESGVPPTDPMHAPGMKFDYGKGCSCAGSTSDDGARSEEENKRPPPIRGSRDPSETDQVHYPMRRP
jgi:hypothetical protein